MTRHRIKRVWVDDTHVWAETADGLTAGYPFERWARLAKASDTQRRNFTLSYFGIHWPEIDEDLNFEGMFSDAGLCADTVGEDAVYYEAARPEVAGQ